MSDFIGASSGNRSGAESPIAPTQNAQAFNAQIKVTQAAMEQGGEAAPDSPAVAAEGRRKKKSPIRKILRKSVRQQAKHYVLMNHLQQTDLEAAYQALARELGSSTARKMAEKP
jgi:hypothetical protein